MFCRCKSFAFAGRFDPTMGLLRKPEAVLARVDAFVEECNAINQLQGACQEKGERRKKLNFEPPLFSIEALPAQP